jgi:DNA-binding CsgD family transcriptional regulator
MAVEAPRLRSELVRLVHRGVGVRDFSLAAARLLARSVSFDGVCVLTMDPATLLPTSEVVEHGLPPAATARMAEIELRCEDFNTFRSLARSGQPAAILSQATDGDLDRSLRHREVRRAHGLGDELRAALVDGETTWGALTLLRGADQRPFTAADAALITSVTRHLAEGLRRAMLLGALTSEPQAQDRPAGFILVAADNTITMADAAAERWLAELREGRPGHPLSPTISAVASQARRIARGPATETVARARVRTRSGRWLLVRASTIEDHPDAPTAVIVEPARPHDLAPLIAAAYALTDREREVAQLVARGHATAAIARRLHLSPWTVQDHLRSIFEKVGVGTRGELIARLFFEQHAPQLSDHLPAR